MARRRPCAVSNHEAGLVASSFETRRRRRSSQDEVLDPHGEERGDAARLEPRGPVGGLILRDARKSALLRMRV